MGYTFDGMEPSPHTAVVAQGRYDMLRELRQLLHSGGLEAEIVRPPQASGNT